MKMATGFPSDRAPMPAFGCIFTLDLTGRKRAISNPKRTCNACSSYKKCYRPMAHRFLLRGYSMKAPTLATERLILRSFELDDVSAFAEVVADKEAMVDFYAMTDEPHEPLGFATWLINDAISSWHNTGFGGWAVCTKSSDLGPDQRVIGFAGFLSEELLFVSSDEALEVAWGIHPEFGGRGLATEASVAALEYGFGVIEADKILAITSLENTPSRRLMERLGMKQSEQPSPYGYDDCVLYTTTKEQWGS